MLRTWTVFIFWILINAFGYLSISSCTRNTPAEQSQTLEAWDDNNDPANLQVKLTTFQDLPREGRLPPKLYPWSADYWATYRGGIAQRWQLTGKMESDNYKDYRYQLPSQEEIKSMTQDKLDLLSPAEKFDIAFERYDFPLVRREWAIGDSAIDIGTLKIPTWQGICHGWAPASLMEQEPGSIATIKNKDGVTINFFSGDLKALVSKVYAIDQSSYIHIGQRCETKTDQIEVDETGRIKQPECRDVNPGALHLLLAHNLGKGQVDQRRGMVIDVARDYEVWNQPLIGYKVNSSLRRQYSPKDDPKRAYRAPQTAFLIDVQTDVYYLVESSTQRAPLKNDNKSYEVTMHLKYSLEVDSRDNIIGGEWTSSEHPDFYWQKNSRPQGTDPILNPYDVYRLSTRSRGWFGF